MILTNKVSILNKRGNTKDKRIYHIGGEATMDMIGEKWKSIILCYLRNGSTRPNGLQRRIPNISQKKLIQQIRELEKDQIIVCKVY